MTSKATDEPAGHDTAAGQLADARALIEQLRDQLAALAEENDADNPGMEIVEVRALLEAADEFLLASASPAEPADHTADR